MRANNRKNFKYLKIFLNSADSTFLRSRLMNPQKACDIEPELNYSDVINQLALGFKLK